MRLRRQKKVEPSLVFQHVLRREHQLHDGARRAPLFERLLQRARLLAFAVCTVMPRATRRAVSFEPSTIQRAVLFGTTGGVSRQTGAATR